MAGAQVLGADFLVHGGVVVRLREDGTYGIYDQPYHFGMHKGIGSSWRNFLTLMGTPPEGSGKYALHNQVSGRRNLQQLRGLAI